MNTIILPDSPLMSAILQWAQLFQPSGLKGTLEVKVLQNPTRKMSFNDDDLYLIMI